MKEFSLNIPEEHTELRPRPKSFVRSTKDICFEFYSNTSIHGFQYFGQHRPRKEIFFWVVVMVISIYFCSSIVGKIYVKWDTTPVIVSFSEKSTPIWSIPFPAVTICPLIKRERNKTGKFSHTFRIPSFFLEAQGQCASGFFQIRFLNLF